MTEAGPRSIAVVCEAPSDREIACALADRVLCEEIDWITPEILDHVRRFRGERESEPHLHWRDVKPRAKEKGIRRTVISATFLESSMPAPLGWRFYCC